MAKQMNMRRAGFGVMALGLLLACGAVTGAAAQPAPPPPPTPPRVIRLEGDEVRLRDLAATVIIRPENRTDIAVTVFNPGPLTAPEVRGGRHVTIDGKLRRRIQSCRASNRDFAATVRGVGRLTADRLPVVEIRMPQHVAVAGNGALRLHVDRAESVDVRLEGCGEADLVSVENEAEMTVSGGMNIRAYDVGEASVRVAGSGEVTLGAVREGLAASLAGEGGLTAARVDGPTNIVVQGQGDVTIRSGHASVLSVVIAGQGDVTHNGSAETLDVVVVGAGDVRVARVEGEISRSVIGSGDVVVGQTGHAPPAPPSPPPPPPRS